MASASTISLGIEVTGAEAFKAALKSCDAESKALSAELTRLSQSTSLLDKGLPGMAQKFTVLGQQLQQQKDKLALLNQELPKAQQALALLGQELERAKASGDATAIERATTAYERQRTTVAGLEQNIAQTRAAVDQTRNSMQQMASGAIAAGFEKLKTVTASLAQGMANVAKAAAEAASAIINKMDQAVKGMALAGTALVGALGKIGVEYNMQMENHHKYQIQHNVDNSGYHHGIERSLGIPHCLENTAARTVQDIAETTQKINPEIRDRIGHNICRSAHPL